MDAVVYDKIDKEAEKVREVLYGIYPQETITGADIAYFTDGADDIPVKALTVGIEPVQDLHGYDHPWPAGGGKNLSPISSMDTTDTGYINASTGSVGTVAAGKTYTLSFMNKTPLTDNVIVRLNVNGTWETLTQGSLVANGKTSYTFTPANNGEVGLSAMLGQKYSPVFTNIQLEEGSAATDFAPYSNICPISGWTGAKVTRTGKNLLYAGFKSETKNGLTFTLNDNGSVTVNGTATATVAYSHNTGALCKNIFRAGETYTLSGGSVFENIAVGYVQVVCVGAKTGGTISIVSSRTNTTYTFAEDATLNGVYISFKNGQTFNNVTVKPQLELGSTATDYEPYQGETYNITFPTEAGIVYGGTLDVTSGKLVVDRAGMVIDGVNVTVNQNGHTVYTTRAMFMANAPAKAYGLYNFRSDKFYYASGADVVGNANGRAASTGTEFFLPASVPDTFDGVNEWFSENNTQFVYELATPIEYTLTPQEITTLLGVNNIWADTGAVKKLAYRADLGKYISSKITEASANILNA